MGDTIQQIGGEADSDDGHSQFELVEEVRVAYSDAGPQRGDDSYNNDDRCLSFLTSGWFTDGQALMAALKAIESYNAFDAEKVADHTRGANQELADIRVAVGREGSPVLYIETDVPDIVAEVFEGYADECWEVDHDAVGTARKWAEEDAGFAHNTCRHDEPPVPAEEFAEPAEDRSVVRAWWD